MIPFLACGDLSAYDSDQTYLLQANEDKEYSSLPPTQSPIDPPYKTACYLKKNNLLASETEKIGEASAICGDSEEKVI